MSTMSGRLVAILFATVAHTGAYFYQGVGWNQNSRLDLTRAMVERRTLRIDALHGNTGDKARVGNELSADPLRYDNAESAEALKRAAENGGRV